MQLLFVGLASVLGLLYSYYLGGFYFSPAVCFAAGLLLIMPTLFNVVLKDVLFITSHKLTVTKNIAINFLILPIIALVIGYFTHDFGIAAGLFLLATLAGGGMVMHWIKSSQASTVLGFILLFVNLIMLTVSFFLFEQFGIHMAQYFSHDIVHSSQSTQALKGAVMVLVVIPFLISRVLLDNAKGVVTFIQKHQKVISNVSIVGIVFYLFALKSSSVLFEINLATVVTALIATLLFYAATIIVGLLLFNLKDIYQRAAFWHTITRYVTLALIVSTFTIQTYGVSMILPIMMAYFIQLPMTILINKKIVSKQIEQSKQNQQ